MAGASTTFEKGELPKQQVLPKQRQQELERREQLVKDATFTDMLTGGLVQLKIGTAQTTYPVYKVPLMKESEYFRTIFGSSEFSEGISGEVQLEDVEPGVVELFIDWSYNGKLAPLAVWRSKYKDANSYSTNRFLAMVYIFADCFLIPRLKRQILIESVKYMNLERHIDVPPGRNLIRFVFSSLPENDPYLQFIVDRHCRRWTLEYHKAKKEEDQGFEDMPSDFIVRMMHTYCKLDRQQEKRLNVEDYL